MKTNNTILVPSVTALDLDQLHRLQKWEVTKIYEACAKILHGETIDIPAHVAAISIKTLPFNVPTKNRLIGADIYTVGQLMEKTEKQLLEIRYFGKMCLVDVVRELDKLKLKLRTA
jgi:DNA-directed RNA polymerase alpha subunit